MFLVSSLWQRREHRREKKNKRKTPDEGTRKKEVVKHIYDYTYIIRTCIIDWSNGKWWYSTARMEWCGRVLCIEYVNIFIDLKNEHKDRQAFHSASQNHYNVPV